MSKIDKAIKVADGKATALDDAIRTMDAGFDFSSAAKQYINEIQKYIDQARDAKDVYDVERIMKDFDARYSSFFNSLNDERNNMQSNYEKSVSALRDAYTSGRRVMYHVYKALSKSKKG